MEIVLPESAKPHEERVPDLDAHIRRLRGWAKFEINEHGSGVILLPADIILDDAADAMEWAKNEIKRLLAGSAVEPGS